MKTQSKNRLDLKKTSLINLNDVKLLSVNGGGDTKPCFLCIRTSNGPGGTILEGLNIA